MSDPTKKLDGIIARIGEGTGNLEQHLHSAAQEKLPDGRPWVKVESERVLIADAVGNDYVAIQKSKKLVRQSVRLMGEPPPTPKVRSSWFPREQVVAELKRLRECLTSEPTSRMTPEAYGENYHRDGWIYACREFKQLSWKDVHRELEMIATELGWEVISEDYCEKRARNFANSFRVHLQKLGPGRPKKG